MMMRKKIYPTVSDEYENAIRDCEGNIAWFITRKRGGYRSALLHLAYYNAGIMWLGDDEDKVGEIAGLLDPVKQHSPIVSYDDFYQLAGVVTLRALGAPHIPFHPGRHDRNDKRSLCLLDPTQGSDHLRKVFVNHMGLTDVDIVALVGGLIQVKGNKDHPDHIFDSSYFKKLLEGEKESDDMQMPLDKALLTDPVFRPFVEKYAEDRRAFIIDYRKAHMKLSELGLPTRTESWKEWFTSIGERMKLLDCLEPLFICLGVDIMLDLLLDLVHICSRTVHLQR